MTDPWPVLKEFSNYAHEYCINLNDMINRERLAFRGGCAAVYLGTLRKTGSRVAVKTIQGGLPGDVKTIKVKVLREAHVWSKLDHKNVLPFIGMTTDFEVSISLVSKWMAMGTAYEYVQDKTVDPRPLVADIARGLCYLHNHPEGPITHGDLKGSNALISDEGHALISDFGYTHMAKSSFNLTVSAPCGGTVNWMAPEMFNSEQEDVWSVRSDVWAFGMTILELFTRKNPFSDLRHWMAIARRILSGPPDLPSDDLTCCRMTPGWWAICSDCWAPDPLLRPSASNLLSRIEITEEITYLTLGLNMLSERAALLGINLDRLVTRNPDLTTSGDGVVIMFQGVLESAGTLLTLQIIRAGLRAANEETVENILQEVLLWSKVHHTNITPVLGITTKFDYTLSIVSTWVELENAYDYVQDEGVDPGPLLLGIANGLKYLHGYQHCPLIHGDLRGINVLVREGGHALITFGITSLVNSLFEAPATRPLNWVAPEELESGGFAKTRQGDVWAFGMTVLELFTRKSPFHGTESESDLKVEIMRGPPERPSSEATCGRLTDAWWGICQLCWKRDPLSRPTMSVIVNEVDQIMHTLEYSRLLWESYLRTRRDSNRVARQAETNIIQGRCYAIEGFEYNASNSAIEERYLGPPIHYTGPSFGHWGAGPSGEVGDTYPTDPHRGCSSQCQFLDCDTGVICLKFIMCDSIAAHMISEHGISGMHRKTRFTCRWVGCGVNMARHNFVRHIREVHLGHPRHG